MEGITLKKMLEQIGEQVDSEEKKHERRFGGTFFDR